MSSVRDIFNHSESSRTYKPSSFFILPDCMIGVEFEYEDAITYGVSPEVAEYYRTVADGSLRDGGVEFVFREPLFGEDIKKALTVMCTEAKKNGYTTGPRTSTHVHMDCRDLSGAELHKLAVLYSATERALFYFAGKGREPSNFCIPWFRSNTYFRYIALLKKDPLDPEKIRDAYTNIQRYSALNWAALAEHGSLEFRHMGGTKDSQKVEDWINIIMCLKKAAKEWKREGYDILLHVSKIGVHAFMREIFGDRLEGHYVEQNIWTGVNEAQNLIIEGRNLDFDLPFKKVVGPGPLIVEFQKKSLKRPLEVLSHFNDSEAE